MYRRLTCLTLAIAAAVACSSDTTAPFGTTPVDGLVVRLAVPGHCIVGGCDPIVGGTTLGLITLANTSAGTLFVPDCGSFPALATQQLVNGKWQLVGGEFACVAGPRAIAIAGHDSLQVNQWFSPGTWRVTIGVGTDSLNDAAQSISDAVVVH